MRHMREGDAARASHSCRGARVPGNQKDSTGIGAVFEDGSAQQQAVADELAAGGLLEHGEEVFDLEVFFLFLGDVEEDFAAVHHDEAVAEFEGVAHVVSDHERREALARDDFPREGEDFLGGLRVEGSGVLVQERRKSCNIEDIYLKLPT